MRTDWNRARFKETGKTIFYLKELRRAYTY